MATTLQDFGGAPALPLSAALEIIPSLPRQLLSRLVARAIERLDEMDGDTDIEPDHSEDDALPPPWWGKNYRGEGAGCPISDPDYGGEELGEPEDGV
jgi:hypothetical protein